MPEKDSNDSNKRKRAVNDAEERWDETAETTNAAMADVEEGSHEDADANNAMLEGQMEALRLVDTAAEERESMAGVRGASEWWKADEHAREGGKEGSEADILADAADEGFGGREGEERCRRSKSRCQPRVRTSAD